MLRGWLVAAAVGLAGCGPAPAGVEPSDEREERAVTSRSAELSRPFTDVTERAGIDAEHSIVDFGHYSIGQAWGDYDSDGWLDLYVTDPGGPNTLFHNRGDGTFEISDLSAQVALSGSESAGATFADYDNDGFADLYVANVGADVLFHNEAGQGFANVTERAVLGDEGLGQTASFADYDGDGWLDLYVANWWCVECESPESTRDRLYHNERDGTFRDVTHVLDPTLTLGAGFVAGFFDYDSDGDPDIYLLNDKGYDGPAYDWRTNRNVLWRNDGPGCGDWCFAEQACEMGADTRADGMGLSIGDYDADGDLDLFFSDTGRAWLLRNQFPEPRFAEVTHGAGLRDVTIAWGNVLVDYDNDGWLDFYLAVGAGEPNELYRNRGDGTFAPLGLASGAADLGDSYGVAAGDYDRDGRVDLVVGNRGSGYRLYRNTARSGHWLTVRLVGSGPVNRDAVGSRVWLDTTDGRSQLCEVSCGGSLGAGHDLACHFGLGSEDIVRVRVQWRDGTHDDLGPLARDREWTIRYRD